MYSPKTVYDETGRGEVTQEQNGKSERRKAYTAWIQVVPRLLQLHHRKLNSEIQSKEEGRGNNVLGIRLETKWLC